MPVRNESELRRLPVHVLLVEVPHLGEKGEQGGGVGVTGAEEGGEDEVGESVKLDVLDGQSAEAGERESGGREERVRGIGRE